MSEVRKAATKHDNLIYDVGMHKGQDTDFYLKKGFTVIGFEADPDLLAYCRHLFAKEIADGKLTIIEGAIVEHKLTTVKFYKNKDNDVWGTADPAWAQCFQNLNTTIDIIDVPSVNFADCLDKYGIPYYLKIDIEGLDSACLNALNYFEQKPDYISIEADQLSFTRLMDNINQLTQLGYTRFNVVQQAVISRQIEPNPSKEGVYVGYQFQEGSSGLFGKDLPCKWKTGDEIYNYYRLIWVQYKLFGDAGTLNNYFIGKCVRKALSILSRKPIPGWHDTHAKHSSVVS